MNDLFTTPLLALNFSYLSANLFEMFLSFFPFAKSTQSGKQSCLE